MCPYVVRGGYLLLRHLAEGCVSSANVLWELSVWKFFGLSVLRVKVEVCSGVAGTSIVNYRYTPATGKIWTVWGLNPGPPTC